MTYQEALRYFGSDYQLASAVKQGRLRKPKRGLYSISEDVSPYAAAAKLYPHAVVTMDSAFYIHGLTDVVPSKIHLATKRNATRIKDPDIRQYFTEKRLLEPGSTLMEYDGAEIRIYTPERMLVELMRNAATLSPDYYKEIINEYRRRVNELDIRAVEDLMDLFKRTDTMFDILQKEVL